MALRDDDTIASTAPGTGEGRPTAIGEGGERIAGRYRIERWLGGGGMGRVYEALDTELGERVALKVLTGELSGELLARFRREVVLTRRIQHRNVARMFDIGDHGGEKFLTMELIQGEPLTRALGGPMPWPRLAMLGEQIAAGLAAAHATGVVHRDLKPDNVLVERYSDRAVITDFGIARGGDDGGNVTMAGAIIGTPRYMAPEQLAGGAVDARADLFALGVILYELATGARPWTGDGPIAIAVAQATQPPALLEERHGVPAAFAALVMQCLALDPVMRPASARAIAEAIATMGAAQIVGPPPPRASATFATAPTRSSAAPTSAAAISAIAVLPFTAAPDDLYLADGIREDLIDTLSTTDGLRVRPAGMVGAVGARDGEDPRAIGRALDVDHVVAGSLRRIPTGVRVAARLINVADGFQVWAHRADVPDAEVLMQSDRMGRAIATALSTRAARTITGDAPMDPRAVELYLRARAELRRFWADHAVQAVELLRQAAAFAPDSPQIAAALVYAEVQAWVKTEEPARLPVARAAVERATALRDAEAYLAAGWLHANLGDVERGMADIGRAVARAPMSASAHELAARMLREVGGNDEARRHYATALAIDPTRDTMIETDLARIDALDGDWATADARLARVARDPDPSIVQLAAVSQARLAGWRRDIPAIWRSVEVFASRVPLERAALATFVRRWQEQRTFDYDAWYRAMPGMLVHDLPRRRQLVGGQRAVEIAMLCEQPQLALEALQRTLELGLVDTVWFERCPLFDEVRADPRWQAARDTLALNARRAWAAFRAASAEA